MNKRNSENYNFKVIVPVAASEWDYEKNYPHKPEDFKPQSNKKFWFTCDICGYSWESALASRYLGSKCGGCSGYKATNENNIAVKYPSMIDENWVSDVNLKNELDPYHITPKSKRSAVWRCNAVIKHYWTARIRDVVRLHSNGSVICPYCSKRKPSDEYNLKITHPNLASQWSPKNKTAPEDYLPGSKEIVWWFHKTEDGKLHEWKTSINNRTKENGTNCPHCCNHIIEKEQSLAVIYPDLMLDWAESNTVDPAEVLPSSGIKVKWHCSGCNHEYDKPIRERTRYKVGKGKQPLTYQAGECKMCKNTGARFQKILRYWCSEIDKEYDLKTIKLNSKKVLTWKCKNNPEHKPYRKTVFEFYRMLKNGSESLGCPECLGKVISSSNSLEALKPDVASEWHPTKNKKKASEVGLSFKDKEIWWKCSNPECEGEWATRSVHQRTREVKEYKRKNGKTKLVKPTGCPYCKNQKVTKTNSVAAKAKHLMLEWDYDNNGSLSPETVIAGSGRLINWICPKCEKKWPCKANERTRKVNPRTCPHCSQTSTSKAEKRIYSEVLYFFPDAVHRHRESQIEMDVYIPSIKVGIEYDSKKYHEKKYEQDKEKRKRLKKEHRIFLINVRETGLKILSKDDVVCNGTITKDVIDSLFRMLRDKGYLSKSQYEEYINRDTFINDDYWFSII